MWNKALYFHELLVKSNILFKCVPYLQQLLQSSWPWFCICHSSFALSQLSFVAPISYTMNKTQICYNVICFFSDSDRTALSYTDNKKQKTKQKASVEFQIKRPTFIFFSGENKETFSVWSLNGNDAEGEET